MSTKSKLKLYMVTVNVLSKNKHATAPALKGYRTYILDSNAVDAESRVVQLIGADRIDVMIPPRVEEVPGPFGKGQVLFWDEF